MLKPPIFADEAKTRTARLLHTVVLAVFVAVVAIAVDVIVISTPPLRVFPFALLGLGALLTGVEMLMRRGRVTTACVVLVVGLWAGFSATLPEVGGIRSPMAAMYLVITLTAGLLLGGRGGLATVLLCTATGGVFFFLDRLGRLPASSLQTAPGASFTMLVVMLGLTVVLLHLFTRQLNRALDDSLQRERELAETNRLLEQQIAERKRTEVMLRDAAHRLALAREMTKLILSARTVERIGRSVVQEVGRLIPGCAATLVRFDHDAGEARLVARHGPPDLPPLSQTVWPLAEFPDLEVLEAGKVHRIADLRALPEPPFPASLSCPRGRACLRIPLIGDGRLLACFTLIGDRIDLFASEHGEIIAELADLLTIAFRQALLSEQLAEQLANLEDTVAERTQELSRRVDQAETLNRALANVLDDYRAVNRKLEATARQLEAVNVELEQFTNSASHDLRQPARAIHGFAAGIVEDLGGSLPEASRHALTRIIANAVRMEQLIDDLLTLSRVTQRPMHRGPVDLSGLARKIMTRLREQHPDRDVTADIQPGVTWVGDPHLLQVVLENLLGNAWKFTEKTSPGRIEFGVREMDGKQVLFVRDNGVGFDMRYANKLFRPFERLHSDSEFPGTGIGLATVHRIIRRHGGRVWAEGKVDGGATFYFTLPGKGERREEQNREEQDRPAGGRQPG